MPSKNWQSDRRFSENYLNSRAQKGYGVERIRQELLQLKGVSSDIIDEVLMESEIDWYEMAENLLRKNSQIITNSKLLNETKIWQYMLSHGFRSDEFADLIGQNQSEWD